MQIYYRKYQIILIAVSLFALVACESNPSHRPSIGGTIELINNTEKDLCFLPKFETAYLTSTITYSDLKFINLSHVDVSLGNDPLTNKMVWEASPNSKTYYELKEGESICMGQNSPQLKEVKYENLSNNRYTVVIRGMDDKEKYNLSFIERFDYPIK